MPCKTERTPLGARSVPPSGAADGLLRLAAIGGEFVAVEVAAITGIGVRPEPAGTYSALVLRTSGERGLVEGIDRGAARRLETDRAAIGRAGRLAVGRGQYDEFLARRAPARAAIAQILDPLVAERRQHRVIELPRLGE